MKRTLVLKRDVLRELSADELREVVGGQTYFSCLDYISCGLIGCLPVTERCIE